MKTKINKIYYSSSTAEKLLKKLAQSVQIAVSGARTKRQIIDSIKSLGFKKFTEHRSSAAVFVKGNKIVKFGGIICSDDIDYFPKASVPASQFNGNGDFFYEIFRVQMRADTSRSARTKAMKNLSRREEQSDDMHSYNVGIFNGRSVVFDW